MKSKYVAAALAFIFGIFGTHRFYLGQRFLGIVYFFLFFVGMMVTIEERGEFPLIILPAVLGFIDSILLAVMPQEEFDERYNKKWLKRREDYAPPRRQARPMALPAAPAPMETHRETLSELKRQGITKFRDYDFHGAIREFQKVLEMSPNDAATHFNMACCYSILENKDDAFYHLSQAVKLDFNNYEKIQNHDALAYLRTQIEFDFFVKNGYQMPATEPAPTAKTEAPREETLILRDDLLDQIIQLGELRNKGILTEEEFAKQKEKILAQR
ncbi:MAG: NINE protein [Anaerolineales bacterium]